jgi:hypothetical protein
VTGALYMVVGSLVAIHGAVRALWSPCGQSMLASLTPIAERARGSSWRVTVSAFALGATGAGALGGVLFGAVGAALPGSSWRPPALVAVLVAALAIDGTSLRRRLPLTKRQVNEDWMARYRGWVYGFGFGAQLGLGFITLVACAAIYASFAVEVLSGSILIGAAIGAVFGATKAATLLPTRLARDPESLWAIHRRLLSLDLVSQRAVMVAEVVALVAVAGAIA